jgi:hypothetical protein
MHIILLLRSPIEFLLRDPAKCLIIFLICAVPIVCSANVGQELLCNATSAFVLNGSIVSVFESSTSCVFPFFPYLSFPPESNSSGPQSVTIVAIGGGGGGGRNGGGGGGAGGVLLQIGNISADELVTIKVGAGGSAGDLSYMKLGSQGESTTLAATTFTAIALGGGFGGSRATPLFSENGFAQVLGGSGGSGGGGGAGSCQGIQPNIVCGAPSTAGGFGSQGSPGGLGFRQSSDADRLSAGAGGGGFATAGTDASSCLPGNGGDGLRLPYAPIMSSWVAGGGGGANSNYDACSNPTIFGLDGLGQSSYGGGGRGGCNTIDQIVRPLCQAQAGNNGVVFTSFAFNCSPGTQQTVLSGFFSVSPCEPCPIGSFSSEIGSMSCNLCMAGTFANSTGMTACAPCEAGTYAISWGQSACSPCAPGSYSASPGRSACSPCPQDHYSDAPSATACVKCPAGTLNPAMGSNSSSACLPAAAPRLASAPSIVSFLPVAASVAASSGHVSRVLELVQFLSIFCTTLASQQQERLSSFQQGSFTATLLSNANENCMVCPGFCVEPVMFVLPTFLLLTAATTILLVSVVCKRCACANAAIPAEDRLLAAEPVSSSSSRKPLLRRLVDFCVCNFFKFIELLSSYMIIPAVFVFVLNVWPSSFSKADNADRVMIIMIPLLCVSLRAIVIFMHIVQLTSDDQKHQVASSTCNFSIAVVISVCFALKRDAQKMSPSTLFPSDTLPQFIILAIFAVELLIHIIISRNATESSDVDRVGAPFLLDLSDNACNSGRRHTVFSCIKNPLAASAADFFTTNYVVLCQMAMVIAGIMSAFAPFSSGQRNNAASVAIGSIPSVVSCVQLVLFFVHIVRWLRRRKYIFFRRAPKDLVSLGNYHGSTWS